MTVLTFETPVEYVAQSTGAVEYTDCISAEDSFFLVGFYGISTFVGYLTPNPFLCK